MDGWMDVRLRFRAVFWAREAHRGGRDAAREAGGDYRIGEALEIHAPIMLCGFAMACHGSA